MALFSDTVTVYNRITSGWKKTVVHGVQWSDKTDRIVSDKVITYESHVSITFPEGTYDNIELDSSKEEDFIVFGACSDIVGTQRGSRPIDIVEAPAKAGFIKSVNDNSNRSYLKNIKVVIQK